MKKMILVAALAAVGSAFAASNCQLGTPVTPQAAAVFNWKFTGKTTVGVKVTETIKAQGSACNIGSSSNIVCAIRVPGSLAIQGYTYVCDNCCGAFKDWTNAGACPDQFYMTKPFKSALTKTIAIDVANIIGKTAKNFEIKGLATFVVADPSETYELTFAGLGSYDQKKIVPTSVCGNFAGTVKSPYYVKNGECAKAVIWDCATLTPMDDDTSVAYGTWSVKYNASASKKYLNGTTVKLPSWVGNCQ